MLVNFGGARMIKVGDVLPEKVFYLDRAMLKAYADASGDQNPIHQSEAFARSVGLPNVIAHGMLTMALVGTFISEWAGGSANIKAFSARFIKPVIVPVDEKVDLTVSATVIEVDGDCAKLECVATSAGIKVLGMARAMVTK